MGCSYKKTLASTNETGGVSGNGDDLKESACYPDEFWRPVAKYYMDFWSRRRGEDMAAKRRRLA